MYFYLIGIDEYGASEIVFESPDYNEVELEMEYYLETGEYNHLEIEDNLG